MKTTALLAAALSFILPIAAHAAEDVTHSIRQNQQPLIERSNFEEERAEVRNRLSDPNDSVADRNTPNRIDAVPSSLNNTAPASGDSMDSAPPRPSNNSTNR